jgi:DNA sulfur modification protein DndD
MSEIIQNVKITGWSYRGLNVPDYDIKLPDPDSNRNFSLILQLSGQGKTTTLNLLRYCFYNFLDEIEDKNKRKNEFDALNNKENPNEKGEFTLFLKLNNNINYAIILKFDFKNYKINYFTRSGDNKGTNPGLNFPEGLKEHLSSEFIKKSFFNLELANELLDEQEKETDKTIINICKLYNLDKISKAFDLYKDDYETKNDKVNITSAELQEIKHAKKKIEERLENIIKKENEYLEKRKILKNELNNLEKEEKKIRLQNSEINERLTLAEDEVRNCETDLSDCFYNCYSFLKNPMKLNDDFFNSLNNFEKKLTKMGIPKSVGESFFSELIESKECLCGKHMDEEMKNNILKNKFKFLTDETYNVLNPIKSKILETKKPEKNLFDETFNQLTKKMGNLIKAKNKLSDVTENIDQEKLVKIARRKSEIEHEIAPINQFLDEIINEKWKETDTPDTESKKSLSKQLENINFRIENATDTVDLGKKIKLIKKYLTEIKDESLEEISNSIIEKINSEVPRVLKYEQIYVKSIKNKISFKDREGAAQGQIVRITYLFLIALLNRSNLKFPFIVDSPVTAMDDISRGEIAKSLANFIDSQYIAFLLPPERWDFADVLDQELNKNINLIVAFPKNKHTENLITQAKNFSENTELEKWSNGIVSYNKEFFYNFKGRTVDQKI